VTFGKIGEQWHCFDDDRISKIDAKDVISENAYVLCYARAEIEFQDLLSDTLQINIGRPLNTEQRRLLDVEEDEPGFIDEFCPWSKVLLNEGSKCYVM